MSQKKLKTFVTVQRRDDAGVLTGETGTFGPNDKLPDWAAKSITNPDVWEDGDELMPDAPASGQATTDAERSPDPRPERTVQAQEADPTDDPSQPENRRQQEQDADSDADGTRSTRTRRQRPTGA